MKKIILLLSAFIAVSSMLAQAPQGINYQGVARNNIGAAISNTVIAVQFQIHQGSPTGGVVFTENHATVPTDTFGLYSLVIGSLTPLSSVNWASGSMYLEIDINGVQIATPQLQSVPYALYAGSSGSSNNGVTAITTNSNNITSSGTNTVSLDLATVGSGGTVGSATQIPIITYDMYGRITGVTTSTFTTNVGTVTQINTGTGIDGGPISVSGTLSLSPSGVTAGNYGNTTSYPTFTVDALGRITNASSQTYTTSGGTVTSVTVAAPMTVTNSTSNPSISMPAATTTTDGYLTQGDWNTFNTKVSSIAAGTGVTVNQTGSTYTINAIPSVTNIVSSNTGLTINPGATTTITANNSNPIWNANQLQSVPVSSVTATTGQVLTYTAGNWVPSTPSIGLPPGANGAMLYDSAGIWRPTNTANISTDGSSISVVNMGSVNTAGYFQNISTGNFYPAVWGVTGGTGAAGLFQNTNSGNTAPTISVTTNSTGNSAFFSGGSGVSTDNLTNSNMITTSSLTVGNGFHLSLNANPGLVLTSDATGNGSWQPVSGGTISVAAPVIGTGIPANPITLSTSGVTSGTYGNSNGVPVLTISNQGIVTSATTTAINGLLPAPGSNGQVLEIVGTIPTWTTNSGLTTVTTNSTLIGNGTSSTPLSLSSVGTASTFGSPTTVPTFTTDAYGRVTNATNVAISGVAPGGAAGGDLAGTYPNPSVAKLQGVSVSTNAPATNQVLEYNGSNWAPSTLAVSGAANGLSVTSNSVELGGTLTQNTTITQNAFNMTYSTSTGNFNINSASTTPALNVVTTGTGNAGEFAINNTSNTQPAVNAQTNGSGPAIDGFVTGTGQAGNFTITNTVSAAAAVLATTNGTGPAIDGYVTGTGNAGSFAITNTANNQAAVLATTNGTGGAGSFSSSSTTSNANALQVTSNGIGNTIVGSNSGTSGNTASFITTYTNNGAATLNVVTQGTSNAGSFQISNTANNQPAIVATTNGTGAGISAVNSGTAGTAGGFQITGASNTAPALYASTASSGAGSGPAGTFTNTNNNNSVAALYVGTKGTGNSGVFSGGAGLQTDNFEMTSGTPTAGAVLTSTNTSGNATWSSPASIVSSGGGWTTLGNAGTADGTNFIGTTDNIPLTIKVNNQKAGRIDPTLRNAFFGYTAGNVATGNYNTFFGDQAGLNTVGSTNNTFIGYNAGSGNVNGSSNTFVGSKTGGTGPNGSANIFVGDSAGYYYTTGSKNIIIGYAAGSAIMANTASNNILIGAGANVSSLGLNNVVALGTNAIVGASNCMVLGSGINVGIGTSVPAALLDVQNAGTNTTINGVTTGTGIAGNFQINNATNSATAVSVSTNGGGTGLSVTSATGSAVNASTSPPSTSTSAALAGFNNGTGGYAANIQTTNNGNLYPTVYVNNAGTGNGMTIANTYAANSNAVISATTNGTGSAIAASITGTGNAGNFVITNASNVAASIYATTNGTGGAIQAVTTGTASMAGNFSISNVTNASPTILATTNGSGAAVMATTSGIGYSGEFSGGAGLKTDNFQMTATTPAPVAGSVLTSINGSGNAAWAAPVNFLLTSSGVTVSTPTATIDYSTPAYNNGGGSVASGFYTAPVTGVYHIDATLNFSSNPSGQIYMYIYVGGNSVRQSSIGSFTYPTTISISADVSVLSGQTINIEANIIGAALSTTGTIYFNGHLVR